MFNQCDIVTMCMEELEKCSLSAIDKMRLETLLIEIKQALLKNDVKNKMQAVPNSEGRFMDLYGKIILLCGPDGRANEVDELIIFLLKIKSDISRMYFQAFH